MQMKALCTMREMIRFELVLSNLIQCKSNFIQIYVAWNVLFVYLLTIMLEKSCSVSISPITYFKIIKISKENISVDN